MPYHSSTVASDNKGPMLKAIPWRSDAGGRKVIRPRMRILVPSVLCVWLWLIMGTTSLSAAASPASSTNTVLLSLREQGSMPSSLRVDANPRTQPFIKEPDLSSRGVLRGTFFTNQGPSNAVAYIWDESKGRLYLDLNRNGDLTDDPAGALTSATGNASYYQVFPAVALAFSTPHGWHSSKVELRFYHYRNNPLNISASVRSVWQGEIQLAGKQWIVAIPDNQVIAGGSLDNFRSMTIRPVGERSRLFQSDAAGINRSTINLPAKWCLDGQVYRCSLAYEGRDEAARIKATITEVPTPMGELQISGTMIEELDLDGDYAVILHSPKPTVKVPVGKYQRKRVYLKAPGSSLEASAQIEGRFNVDANQPTVINIGGPLRQKIAAERRGAVLALTYQLTGMGGDSYTLSQQNRSKPPEFAIFQGARKLHSGKFEYG